MNLLWGFEFRKGRGEDGAELEPDLWNFYPGVTHDPKPFVISPKPRSERHEQLIRQNFIASAEILLPFEQEFCEDRKSKSPSCTRENSRFFYSTNIGD